VTEKVLLWPVAISFALLLSWTMNNVIIWWSKGCLPLQKGIYIRDIELWRVAQREHGVSTATSNSTRRIRLCTGYGILLMATAGCCVLVIKASAAGVVALPVEGYEAFLILAGLAVTGAALSAVALTRIVRNPNLENLDAAKGAFFKAVRQFRRAANRMHIANLAAVPESLVPRFWDAVEHLTIILMISRSWLHGLESTWSVSGKLAYWFCLGGYTFSMFQLFQMWLHSLGGYAQLAHRFRHYVEGPQTTTLPPFGRSEPASGHELQGLR
jgi:hypothetical protein